MTCNVLSCHVMSWHAMSCHAMQCIIYVSNYVYVSKYVYVIMYVYVITHTYIYIYGRGRGFPERMSIRIIELEKKQCFTVVKWRFFMLFFSLLVSFNYGSIFFSSVEVEVSYGPSHFCFFGALIFSIGITRWTFCFISKIIGKGYNILCFHRYFDVMLFFIGNSQ